MEAQEDVKPLSIGEEGSHKEQVGEKNWFDDDELFQKWRRMSDAGYELSLVNIRHLSLREGYSIPCFKPNVMNSPIPAGSRAGARPCSSPWKAFGGMYIQGQTQKVYCNKCWVAYCLTKKVNLQYAYKQLQRYANNKQ